MDPNNPYQAFNQVPSDQLTPASGLRRSILTQIRVISILLIVHGVMLMLVGILFAVMTFIIPSVLVAQNKQLQQQPNGPSPEQMETIMYVMYGLMGTAGIFPGLLQIFAGIANLRLKGRIFGIVALLGGLVSVATCYCAPTAIGLGVYGLVIYFNESAIKAFGLVAEGKTMAQVEQIAS